MDNPLLTNESLMKEEFASQFELVNYAIKIAQDVVKTGNEPMLSKNSRNPAYQVLYAIANKKERSLQKRKDTQTIYSPE